MTLEQLFQNNGGLTGFQVRSTKTQNILTVLERRASGNFIVIKDSAPEDGEKIVKGNVDRYELAPVTPALDPAALEARFDELCTEVETLEAELSELEEKIDEKRAEMDEIELQLQGIE